MYPLHSYQCINIFSLNRLPTVSLRQRASPCESCFEPRASVSLLAFHFHFHNRKGSAAFWPGHSSRPQPHGSVSKQICCASYRSSSVLTCAPSYTNRAAVHTTRKECVFLVVRHLFFINTVFDSYDLALDDLQRAVELNPSSARVYAAVLRCCACM